MVRVRLKRIHLVILMTDENFVYIKDNEQRTFSLSFSKGNSKISTVHTNKKFDSNMFIYLKTFYDLCYVTFQLQSKFKYIFIFSKINIHEVTRLV